MCFKGNTIAFLDNIPKYSYVFPAVIVFCKMSMFLLSSLSNMIIDSASDRLVGGLVVREFDKTQEKHVWGSDFACALWSRFINSVILILFFLYWR